MKLHLPKMLLTAVLVATAVPTVWAGTGLYNNQSYLIGGTDTSGGGVNASTVTGISQETSEDNEYLTTFIDQIDASALSSFNVWADAPSHARTNAEIKNWIVQTGATITVSQSEWKVNDEYKYFNELNIQKLTGNANLAVTIADHVVSIDHVTGSMLDISNAGTLTIGTADSTTTLNGTITNSGTLTILGTASVSINDYSTFEAISGGESTYSYDEEKSEGFRNVAEGEWYLVKENTGTLNITAQDDWTVNRDAETNGITSITFKSQAFTGSIFHINGSDINEATLIADTTTTGVTATTKYEITAGALTLAGDISTEDRLSYNGGTIKIGDHKLTIATGATNPSALLKNTTGSGTIVLQTTADIAKDETLQFTGKLSLATGGTLNLGSAKEGAINISNVKAIEFDGGTLNYYGLDSTLNSISTTAAGGTLVMKDYKDSYTTETVLANDTNLVGALTIDTTWKSYLNIDHLTGAGDLILKSVTHNDAIGAHISIDSMSGYTGNINLQGKYEETTNAETGEVTTTSRNKVTLTATLDEGYTLESSRVLYNKEECCSLVLKGSGAYALAQGSASMGIATLDSTWTGTVVLEKATLTDANLNDYGNTNSTVELSSATGSLAEDTINTNVKFTLADNTPGVKINNTTGKTVTFAGAVSGDGNFVVEATNTSADTDTYVFSGDISNWNTKDVGFISATDANVEFTGKATTINNGIYANGGTLNATISGDNAVTVNGDITNSKWATSKGTLNLTVNNTSTEGVTFTNTVKADKATIAAGSKATFTGTTNLDTIALGAGLSADAAAITTSGALTLGKFELDLTTYTGAGEFLLVSKTGNGSINWTEGSWTQTGLADGLTANVGFNEDGGLSLTISADVKDITTTVLDKEPIWDGETLTLTLTVDDNLDGVGSVIIEGFEGVVLDKIFALDGMEANTMVGITLVGADGKELSAVPVGDISNIGFRGNDGIYYGQNVDGSTQYNVSYIPEPTTATLSLLALMGLAARRRRK